MMLTDMPDNILTYITVYLELSSTLNYGLLSKRFLSITDKVISSRKNVHIRVPRIVSLDEANRVAARFSQIKLLKLYYGMRVGFYYCCEILPPTFTLHTLSVAFPHCEDLHVNCYRNITSQLSFRRICHFMPCLYSLTIENAAVNEDDIVEALKDMIHLKAIKLINITGITEKLLSGLPPAIEKVYWVLKQQHQQQQLPENIMISKEVASHIKEFSYICDNVYISLLSTTNLINVVSEKFGNIMKLELGVKQISLSLIQKLNMPSLKFIKLDVCEEIIFDMFNPFSKSYVDEISLEFHSQSTDTVYVKLFNNFRNIKKLSINCTELILTDEICRCIYNLHSLSVFEFTDNFWDQGKHFHPSSVSSVPVELCKNLTNVTQFLIHINLFLSQAEFNKIVRDFQSLTVSSNHVKLCLHTTLSIRFF